MVYKALILDLDGTAIPNRLDGMPSQAVIESVKKAKEHVVVSAATGRPYHLCNNILQALGIVAPCVIDGGSQIIDMQTGEVMYERVLPIATIKKVLEVCLPFRYNILSSDDTDPLLDSLEKAAKETQKLCLVGASKDDTIQILEALTAVDDIAAYPVMGSDQDNFDIHITDIQATKRQTLKKLLDFLHVSASETIGVGDSNNDLPLFDSVGLKVAMGNAAQELKQKADYIAPSVEEDGVVDVIETFILQS